MEALHGIDGVLFFKKNGNWTVFGCCETVEVTVNSELISIKTIGDGTWDRSAEDGKNYTLSCSGIIQYDDEPNRVNHFDLLELQAQGLELEWYISFKQNDKTTELTSLWGTALVVTSTVSAPNDFVNSSFEFRGQGELNRGAPPICTKKILSNGYTVLRIGLTFRYKVTITALNSAMVYHYEYRVDGGDSITVLNNIWTIDLTEVLSRPLPYGSHVLEIWPVCENGIRGEKTTRNFTIPFGL